MASRTTNSTRRSRTFAWARSTTCWCRCWRTASPWAPIRSARPARGRGGRADVCVGARTQGRRTVAEQLVRVARACCLYHIVSVSLKRRNNRYCHAHHALNLTRRACDGLWTGEHRLPQPVLRSNERQRTGTEFAKSRHFVRSAFKRLLRPAPPWLRTTGGTRGAVEGSATARGACPPRPIDDLQHSLRPRSGKWGGRELVLDTS